MSTKDERPLRTADPQLRLHTSKRALLQADRSRYHCDMVRHIRLAQLIRRQRGMRPRCARRTEEYCMEGPRGLRLDDLRWQPGVDLPDWAKPSRLQKALGLAAPHQPVTF